jgi:hypothetical protein
MLPLLALLLRRVLVGRAGMIILSVIVAQTAWHWMTERGDVLWHVEWPELDKAGITILARWLAGLLIAGGAVGFWARRMRIVRPPTLPSLEGGEFPGSRGATARSLGRHMIGANPNPTYSNPARSASPTVVGKGPVP